MGGSIVDQLQLDLNETCNLFPQTSHPSEVRMCTYYTDFFLPVRLATCHPGLPLPTPAPSLLSAPVSRQSCFDLYFLSHTHSSFFTLSPIIPAKVLST